MVLHIFDHILAAAGGKRRKEILGDPRPRQRATPSALPLMRKGKAGRSQTPAKGYALCTPILCLNSLRRFKHNHEHQIEQAVKAVQVVATPGQAHRAGTRKLTLHLQVISRREGAGCSRWL